MQLASLKALSQNPPPAPRNEMLRFKNLNLAQLRMKELEESMGLPAGKPIYNIRLLNNAICDLEQALAYRVTSKRSQSAGAAESAPVPPFIQSARASLAAAAGVPEHLFKSAGGPIPAAPLPAEIQTAAKELHGLARAAAAAKVEGGEPISVAPELKGRARMVAAVKIQGSEPSPASAENLTGISRMKAAMRIDGQSKSNQ